MCAVFSSIATAVKTGDDALDSAGETIFHTNWVRVEEPTAGTSIRTNDGKRLLFPVTVRGCAGTLTLYIQESAALALSGCVAAQEFEEAVAAGAVCLRQLASVKLIRVLASSRAAQPADQKTDSGGDELVDQVDVRILEDG